MRPAVQRATMLGLLAATVVAGGIHDDPIGVWDAFTGQVERPAVLCACAPYPALEPSDWGLERVELHTPEEKYEVTAPDDGACTDELEDAS